MNFILFRRGSVELIFVLLAYACVAVGAVSKQEEALNLLAAPKLSQSGIQRVTKNLNTLDLNIKDLESNLSAADQNIETLKTELSVLDDLQKEHSEVRLQCEKYLTDIKARIAKNDSRLRSLEKIKPKIKDGADGPDVEKKDESLKSDQMKEWREDSLAKVDKISNLLKEVQYNLNQVKGRREVLQTQINSWRELRKEFFDLSNSFKLKKAELEKLLKDVP